MSKIWVFALLFPSLCFSQGLLQSKDKLEDVQQKIKEKKQQIKQVEGKRKNILGDLHKIEKRKDQLAKNHIALEEKIKENHLQIQKTTAQKNETQQKVDQHKSFMKEHFRNLYMHGSINVLQTFFEKMDTNQRRQQNVYIRHWVNKEREQVETFVSIANDLEMQTEKLLIQEKEQKELLNRSKKNLLALENEQKNKKHLLAGILGQKDLYQQSLNELEQASAKIQKMISNLESKPLASGSSFEKAKGLLRHPVLGTIQRRYGSYDDQTLKAKVYHKGIDYQVEHGASVESVYAGRVVYAGWFEGYGKVVIVDHGSHYFSLYAHLSVLSVSMGQSVTVGTKIGEVGDTGSIKGAHLYFELRKQGVTINPHPWFA